MYLQGTECKRGSDLGIGFRQSLHPGRIKRCRKLSRWEGQSDAVIDKRCSFGSLQLFTAHLGKDFTGFGVRQAKCSSFARLPLLLILVRTSPVLESDSQLYMLLILDLDMAFYLNRGSVH